MDNSETLRRNWAEIYKHCFVSNYYAVKHRIPHDCKILGVVKADAYGHGAVHVAKWLEELNADYLAVACLQEAVELRDAKIKLPILVLGYTSPERAEELIDHDITQSVGCLSDAYQYAGIAESCGKKLKIHIQLDTGMSRLGFRCDQNSFDKTVNEISDIINLTSLDSEGIYTHFSVSDMTDEKSKLYTDQQYCLFKDTIHAVENRTGFSFRLHHCANSGAIINHPEMAENMVRAGIVLYGYGDVNHVMDIKPCMAVKTRLSSVKRFPAGTMISYGCRYTTTQDTTIGVLGIGYADGLPRNSSGKCRYFLGNQSVKQIGTICMDMCMVELENPENIQTGHEVEIFGLNADLNQICAAAETIPYELLCRISKRVPRIYLE